MLLSQIRKLKELREQYGLELAVAKQSGSTIESDDECLSILSFFDLHNKIVSAVNEYAQITGDDPTAIASTVVLLDAIAGGIAGVLSAREPEMAKSALSQGEETKMKHYLKGKES